MNKIKACIFDLDGVIVDTAKYHFKAWRRLANELGFDFTEDDNEKLKGISRVESLNLILEWGNVDKTGEEKAALATQKNQWYREYIDRMSNDEILPGVVAFLNGVRKKQIKMILGSASKNASLILERIGLTSMFDGIIDGTHTTKSKPDPEVFLMAAAAAETVPKHCIVFEDAVAGVEAALRGGFYTVGVGHADVLDQAHIIIPSFEYIDYEEIVEALSASVGSLK